MLENVCPIKKKKKTINKKTIKTKKYIYKKFTKQ